MYLFLLVLFTFFYVTLAKRVVRFLARYNRKLKLAAILFFVLLPFIDVLIGYMVYFSLCFTDCGKTVYKTQSEPASICINEVGTRYGVHNYGVTDISIDSYLFDEVLSVTVDVGKNTGRSIVSDVGLNTFFINSEGLLSSKKVSSMDCDVLYKYDENKLFLLPVHIKNAALSDMKTGEMLSESTAIKLEYLGFGIIPYFNWVGWHDSLIHLESCYDDFDKFKDLVTSTIHR